MESSWASKLLVPSLAGLSPASDCRSKAFIIPALDFVSLSFSLLVGLET